MKHTLDNPPKFKNKMFQNSLVSESIKNQNKIPQKTSFIKLTLPKNINSKNTKSVILPKLLENSITIPQKKYGHLQSPISRSYTKDAFGSIPSKNEKILIYTNTKNKLNKIFHDRFYDPTINISITENPGVGEYNLSNNINTIHSSVKMDTEDSLSTYINYQNTPPVGLYDITNGENNEKERNNMRYRSIFYGNISNEDKIKEKKSDIYKKINLSNLKLLVNSDKKEKNNNEIKKFSSYKDRRKKIIYYSLLLSNNNINNFSKISKTTTEETPGPGYYNAYSEKDIKIKKNDNKNLTQKSAEIYDLKKTDMIFKNNSNTIFNKSKRNDNMYKKYSKYTYEKITEMYKQQNKEHDIRNELEKKLNEYVEKKKYGNDYIKRCIKEEKELEKIKKIIGNDGGKQGSLFLAQSRWREGKYQTKVPGPAYYFPE